MAITSIKRQWKSRGGKAAGLEDTSTKREWRVTVNSTYDDDRSILQYGQLNGYFPIPYVSRHPTSPALLCKSVTVSPGDAWNDWKVVATWDSKPPKSADKKDEEENKLNPIDRRAKITVSSEMHTRYARKDLDGKPYETSAGEPLDPQAFDETRFVFHVEKNVSAIPFDLLNFPDSINKKPFTLLGIQFPKHTMKYSGYSNTALQSQTIIDGVEQEYYTISFDLHYNKHGWEQPIIDEGFYYLDKNGDKVAFTEKTEDGNEVKVSVPQYLDGNGGKLEEDKEPVELKFNDYRKLDFSVLPLT